MYAKPDTLLVLDETERSMVIEALRNYVNYSFPKHLFRKDSEKYFIRQTELLDKLNATRGGFRLKIKEDDMYVICEALRWNSRFIVSDKERNNSEKMDEYTELSYVLEGRHKNIYLFSGFDPKQYALNTQLKPFKKFDFTQKRILLIRFEKGEMEFIKEFYREPNETDEQYAKRADEAVIKENADCAERVKYNERFLDMKYQAVFFIDLTKHNLKKEFSYHT